jgi:hypothetical protein
MFYYVGPSARGLPPDWFLGAVVARDLMVAVLMALVVRSVLRPATDPVRAVAPPVDLRLAAPHRGPTGHAWGADDPDWPASPPTARPAADRPVLSSSAPA